MSNKNRDPNVVTEASTPDESIMVGGDLTARQTAILEFASHHPYVKEREVVERGDTHLLLRGKRGGLTVLFTMLDDLGAEQAEVVFELHWRYPDATLRVLLYEPQWARSLFNVEAVADHYNRSLRGYIDTPSRAIAGASFHPLRVGDWELERLLRWDDGTWEDERAARDAARRCEQAHDAFVETGGDEFVSFRSLWTRVMADEVCVTISNGDEGYVRYEWAVAQSPRDEQSLLQGAFEAGIRSEGELRSWVWDAVEQELHDIAAERVALRDGVAA